MWDLLKRFLTLKLTKKLDEYEKEQKEKPVETKPIPLKVVPSQARETVVVKPPPTIPKPTSNTNLPSLKFGDGRGGLLWKHHSESDGKVVILLPSAFPKADKVFITNGDQRIHAAWSGWHNPEHTKDGPKNRGHYRLPLSAKQIQRRLGKSVTLVANFGGVIRKVEVPNVRKRHD